MLKKLYQKNGIIHIYDQEYYQNKDIKMCFIMVNNYDKDKIFEKRRRLFRISSCSDAAAKPVRGPQIPPTRLHVTIVIEAIHHQRFSLDTNARSSLDEHVYG